MRSINRVLGGVLAVSMAASLTACGGEAAQQGDLYAGELQLERSTMSNGKMDALSSKGERVEHFEARHGEVHINKLRPSVSSHNLRSVRFFIKVDRSKTDWGGWRLEQVGFRQHRIFTGPHGSSDEGWDNSAANAWAGSDHYFSKDFSVSSNYHESTFEAVLYVKLRHTQQTNRVRYLWVHPGDGAANFSIDDDVWSDLDAMVKRAGFSPLVSSPEKALPTWWDELYRRYNPGRLR